MRVAVTGGSGQLGTLVLRRLADTRAVKEIVALDLRPPLIVSGKLREVRIDVRDPGIGQHLQGCDALIHLAFLVAKRGQRELQDDINVRGSANVFDAALQAGVRRILYASSVAAYGVVPELPVPVVETTERTRQPGFWYACAKFDVEARLDQLEAAHPDLSVARFRPAILIGRRMEHQLGAAMRRGYFPDGGSMPVVWDEDVADAFILALKSGARGAFILAAKEPLPSRELAKAAGLRRLRVPRGPLRALEAIATGLGWKPRCPTSREVMRCYAENVPRRLDRRIAVFARVVDGASRREPLRADLAGCDATVHLDLTGPGGGDFTLRAHDGRVRLLRGAPRPAGGAGSLRDGRSPQGAASHQATVTLKAATLLDLLAGRTDLAGAQLSGRLRVDGQALAGMLVLGVVESFRAASRQPGLRGLFARRLARWMA